MAATSTVTTAGPALTKQSQRLDKQATHEGIRVELHGQNGPVYILKLIKRNQIRLFIYWQRNIGLFPDFKLRSELNNGLRPFGLMTLVVHELQMSRPQNR